MVTVCVAFNRGVNLTTDVSYCISEDGTQLELKEIGIKRLNHVDTLHEYQRSKNKDSLLSYHPKIIVIAFQEFFKVIKAHEEDNLVCSMRNSRVRRANQDRILYHQDSRIHG
jgi:hypothetical protein